MSFFEHEEFDGVAAIPAAVAVPQVLAEIQRCAGVAVLMDRALNSLLARTSFRRT
jgi:hypothetical protein